MARQRAYEKLYIYCLDGLTPDAEEYFGDELLAFRFRQGIWPVVTIAFDNYGSVPRFVTQLELLSGNRVELLRVIEVCCDVQSALTKRTHYRVDCWRVSCGAESSDVVGHRTP